MRNDATLTERLLGRVCYEKLDLIFAAAFAETGYDKSALRCVRRHDAIVHARHAVIYLMRTHCPNMSISHISRVIDKDHSTILSALDGVKRELERGGGLRTRLIRSIECRMEAGMESTKIPMVRIDPAKLPMVVGARRPAPSMSVPKEEKRASKWSSHSGYIDGSGAIICLPW